MGKRILSKNIKSVLSEGLYWPGFILSEVYHNTSLDFTSGQSPYSYQKEILCLCTSYDAYPVVSDELHVHTLCEVQVANIGSGLHTDLITRIVAHMQCSKLGVRQGTLCMGDFAVLSSPLDHCNNVQPS